MRSVYVRVALIGALVLHGAAVPMGIYLACIFGLDKPILTIIAVLGTACAASEFLTLTFVLKARKRS